MRSFGRSQKLRLEKALAWLDVFSTTSATSSRTATRWRCSTFLAERYERKSVLLTSNLLCRDWGGFSRIPMTTGAAIDRLDHHAVLIEMDGPRIREQAAKGALPSDASTSSPAKDEKAGINSGEIPLSSRGKCH